MTLTLPMHSKRVVGAALGQVDQMRHQVALDLLRIDEMGHAELLAPSPRGAGLRSTPTIMSAPAMPRALDHVQADAAQAEHDDIGAGLDLGGVDHRADAGGDAAADVADLVERRVLADLRQRDLRQHGVVREGRAAHVVVDRLAARARSGWCRPASRPCPGSRGSRCRDWSCATGRICTAGIPACRAG